MGVAGTWVLHCQLLEHLVDRLPLCLVGEAALMGGVNLALPLALALFPCLLGLLLQPVLLQLM